MHYKFFANSQKSWQAMYNIMLSAEKSIYLEMYIFQDDMIDFNFIKLLKEKAHNGLRVRIILDYFGSYSLSNKIAQELRDTGVELIFLSYFLHRTHRKILIVDEKIAFVGGVNFHQSASLWNDLMVQIDGKLVSFIVKSFAKTYKESGGKDPLLLIHAKNKILKNIINDWLVEHSPVKNKYNLKKIYKNHLSNSQKSVFLVTPYFMPKSWLIAELHQAILRGVRVEILVPQNTDSYFVDRVNHFFMNKLSYLGVIFYLEQHMNHAKIMTIDDKEAIVGSNNLDYLSFEMNSEVGIFFNNQQAVGKISAIINEWKKDTVLFETKTYPMRWYDYILYLLIQFFYKII
ncbi:MAG: phosphatidylserine/phosphatidylglycerophosphate/cardiolipin synthase family protein [Candidatus Nomurabacteria bacterium]|nr:phosphatidylserine/phosphatidylglycerophosphate/cardiolipin synthase family protein [Candidatus Nomurabacteria bacterium]